MAMQEPCPGAAGDAPHREADGAHDFAALDRRFSAAALLYRKQVATLRPPPSDPSLRPTHDWSIEPEAMRVPWKG